MNNEAELTNRIIPGITWKLVVGFSIALITLVTMYIDLRNAAHDAYDQSVKNNTLFLQIQKDMKDDRKIEEARIQAIELQIRECKIRLDIMENFIEGYNKPQK